jgi:hypothetical protein
MLTVEMGYGDTMSLPLSADECAELISAVEVQVGPDPRVKELQAECDNYRAQALADERLIAALRDGAR